MGMLTGALYKSALGMKPAMVASCLGGVIIVGLTFAINGLNDHQIIGFRMDM